MSLTNIKKSYIFASLTVLLWSTVATAFKIALKYLEPAQLLLFSSATSLIFFLIILIFNSRNKIDLSSKSLLKSMLAGLINPFLYYLILFEAYNLLPAQIAQPLNYTWVIVVTIFMALFIKKEFKIYNFIGLIISFLGVIVLSSQGKIDGIGEINLFGVVLALMSSIFWAVYWLINLKDSRDDFEKLFLNFLFGTIFIFIYIIFRSKIIFPIEGVFAAIYIGLFEMGLTFFLWLKALRFSNNPQKTGNIIYLTPFLSLVFISIILNEPISIFSIIGLIFIIAGILYTTIIKMKN